MLCFDNTVADRIVLINLRGENKLELLVSSQMGSKKANVHLTFMKLQWAQVYWKLLFNEEASEI